MHLCPPCLFTFGTAEKANTNFHWIIARGSVETPKHYDPGVIFNCKECVKSNENTAVKVVSESSTITSPVRTLTIPPCVSSHDKAPVAAILEEERGDVCSVCDMKVEGELRKRCSLCSMMVHSRCTTEEDEEVCLNCAAAEDQHKQVHVQSAITLDDEGEFNDSLSMVQEPGRPEVKPAEKPLEPTSANCNVQPMSTGTNSPKINTNELKEVLLSNNSDSTQPGASQKTTLVPKVVKDTTKPAKGRQITTECQCQAERAKAVRDQIEEMGRGIEAERDQEC